MTQDKFIQQCYEKILSAKTVYDIFQFLKIFCENYNFDQFAVFSKPTEWDQDLRPLIWISNWPPELLSRYDERQLLKNNPATPLLFEKHNILEWNIDQISKESNSEKAAQTAKLFREFNMLNGICFRTYDTSGKQGIVSFSGIRKPINGNEYAELHLISLHMFNRLSIISSETAGNKVKITRREKDCLIWAAQGKTNAEIGDILSISENTVAGYVTAVCRKLKASNKTHAVAKSLRSNLLK